MLKRVEKYDIVDEIGHGGMATVYRARDSRLDRMVALKVMHPHLQGAKEARQRFAREALTVARLHHPSILEIYDYSGEDSETSFISTELLTGPTLKQFVEAHHEIPAEIAACIAIQIARALAAAHAEGVIHRDVKPENVLLHENRCVKLTDFGIAQLVDVQGMTTTGQVLGSPAHMAPEQIEGKECDPRSDLFSLGTVLYMLATGELPFSAQNPHTVLKRIMEGQFKDPLQLRPAIGGKLAGIIRRLLQVDPAARYQTADDLVSDLTQFVAELGIDSPDEILSHYFAGTSGFVAQFKHVSIEKLIELGELAQRRGSVPHALDYYNRVLAIDESNQRVLNSVQRLGRRSALRRLSLVAGAALALLALTSWGVYAALRPSAGAPSKAIARRVPAASATVQTQAPSNARVDTLQPANGRTPEPPRSAAAGKHARAHPPPVAATPPPSGPRPVSFNPVPANVAIGVDGEAPRPFGPSFHAVELEPGVHRFKFVGAHECCIDEEVSVKVPPGEGTFTVAQRLKFRPAGLYVVTDTPANVSVDGGKIFGRSRSVIQVPDLTDLVETHHIRVTAEGRPDHVEDVRLQAGQVVTVEVAMKAQDS
jgi:serine/threonine-protein kinase